MCFSYIPGGLGTYVSPCGGRGGEAGGQTRRENRVFGCIESNLSSSLSISKSTFLLSSSGLSLWCIVLE